MSADSKIVVVVVIELPQDYNRDKDNHTTVQELRRFSRLSGRSVLEPCANISRPSDYL